MTDVAETRCSPLQAKHLVEAATRAASPDNNQPWRFVDDGGAIFVFEDRSRRLPSDVRCMFSLLALGSAIESLAIAASEQGFEAAIDLFPDGCDPANLDDRPIASVCFVEGNECDPLARHLQRRATNRRPYATAPIAPSVLDALRKAAQSRDEVDVHWLTAHSDRKAFAHLVAVSDRLRFEYAPFHAELFKQLRFTAGAAEATRDGLDLRLLALPPGARLVLRCLQSWPIVSTLNRVGLSRALALPAARLAVQSAAIGLITVDCDTPQAFVEGGRAFQRLWLTAEAAGLALHPLGSLPVFLAQGHGKQHEGTGDTASRRTLQLERLVANYQRLVPAACGRTLLIAFRLGYAKPPSIRSLRRHVEKVLTLNE